jgi:DNA-binding NtrC family response regulator
MDCNVLIVDPEEEARDFFHESFSNEGFSALLAEEVNLNRALRFIETENLHYLFLGPNLEPIDIKNFIKDTSVCSKLPVIVLLAKSNLHLESEFIKEGITSTLSYPLKSKALVESISIAKEKFYASSLNTKNQNLSKSESLNKKSPIPQIGSAHQLALVLSKLSLRLGDFSKLLSSLPMETNIKNESIPLAVNDVINKVTKLRKNKENEDLDALLREIVKE